MSPEQRHADKDVPTPPQGWPAGAWSNCQALWTFSPFSYSSNNMEKRYMDSLKESKLSITKLACFISMIVGGVKAWRYGLWDTNGVQVAFVIGAAFYTTVALLIKCAPTFFLKNYHIFMLLSRSFKAGLTMWVHKVMVTQGTGESPLGFAQDLFTMSLVEVLLLMPLVDPMSWVPNLATQLLMLAAATSRNGARYMVAYSAKSPLVTLVSRLPLAPSLGSLYGLPKKAINGGGQCGLLEGVSSSSVLSQLQLNVCALGLVLSLLIEIGRRRAFLHANLHLLGRRAAQKAQFWPLGDTRGFTICTTVFIAFVQGYLLLAELLVQG